MNMFRLKSLCALPLLAAALPASAITGGTSTFDFETVGDGVQITANWVLTAKHLGFTVAPGAPEFSNGYGSSPVAAVYTYGPGFLVDDLMLLRLATPLTDSFGNVPWVSLSSTVWTDSNALDLPVTMASNSNTAPGFPRAYAHSQVRAYATLFDIDEEPLTPDARVNWLIASSPDGGAPYVQGGDSGGGLFYGHRTDDFAPLMGIASALISEANQAPFSSGFVSVAAYRGWIDATMAGDLTDDQMAIWVSTPVPEPAGAALGLLGVLCALAGARRQRGAGLAGQASQP